MNKKEIFSIFFKILTLSCLLFGVILNLSLTRSVQYLLAYYTLQSNILCIVAYVVFIILTIRKQTFNNIYYLLKGSIIVSILITGIVYHLSLVPSGFDMYELKNLSNQIANTFVHTIAPILVLFDYIFFDIKGNFKIYYPFIWLILPVDYIVFVYLYSAGGGRFYSIGGSRKFGYIFLDYQKIGISKVNISIIALFILILIISYTLVFFDKKISNLKQDKKNKRA